MLQQPQLSNMNRQQIEKFNEIRILLKQGKIPAYLVSPEIINMHNACNPDVAKVTHGSQELSLDGLALLYASDGVEIRRFFKGNLNNTLTTDDTTPHIDPLAARSRSDRHMFIGEDDV